MEDNVEIKLKGQGNNDATQAMRKLFEPIGLLQLTESDDSFQKSWDDTVQVILTLVGGWAVKRYVLDILGEHAEQWLKGVTELLRKSNNRRFNLVVIFDDPAGNFQINLTGTSNPKIISQSRKLIEHAGSTYEHARKHGVKMDSISVQADGTKEVLVIGHAVDGTLYAISLDKKDFKKIEIEDADVELWALRETMERLNYLEAIKELGHEVSEGELTRLKEEIKVDKQPFLF